MPATSFTISFNFMDFWLTFKKGFVSLRTVPWGGSNPQV